MLEKRESIVSVTSSRFSKLLDNLRNLDKSGRLLTKQFLVIVLPFLEQGVEVTALAIWNMEYTRD